MAVIHWLRPAQILRGDYSLASQNMNQEAPYGNQHKLRTRHSDIQ